MRATSSMEHLVPVQETFGAAPHSLPAFKAVVDFACIVLPICVFMSPVTVFWPAYRQNQWIEVPPLPFTSQVGQCFLWCLFGLCLAHHDPQEVKPEEGKIKASDDPTVAKQANAASPPPPAAFPWVVVLPNLAGLLLGVVFVYLYPKFILSKDVSARAGGEQRMSAAPGGNMISAPNSSPAAPLSEQFRVQMFVLVAICLLGVGLFEFHCLDTIGYTAAFIGCFLHASPVFAFHEAIRTGNAKVLGTVTMNVTLLVCGIAWVLQGALYLHKVQIMLPNGLGTLANLVALLIRGYLSATHLQEGTSKTGNQQEELPSAGNSKQQDEDEKVGILHKNTTYIATSSGAHFNLPVPGGTNKGVLRVEPRHQSPTTLSSYGSVGTSAVVVTGAAPTSTHFPQNQKPTTGNMLRSPDDGELSSSVNGEAGPLVVQHQLYPVNCNYTVGRTTSAVKGTGINVHDVSADPRRSGVPSTTASSDDAEDEQQRLARTRTRSASAMWSASPVPVVGPK
ncbi:unnamed protein product [Amoebophrya sp. A120]|nr:unnamed protein product [Amoebophrya sp. A120]|eukprot:GSA120T00010628001.1